MHLNNLYAHKIIYIHIHYKYHSLVF